MKKHTKKIMFASAILLELLYCSFSFSQSKITGTVKGLAYNDSAIVRIQKSGEQFFLKKLEELLMLAISHSYLTVLQMDLGH